jgi:hypothetical protein
VLRKAEEQRALVSFIFFVRKDGRLVQSRLRATGFDGIVLERENRAQPREGDLAEQRLRKYKAYLCASVTTEDEAALKSAYDEEMDKTFSKLRSQRKKRVYKAAHLARQLKEGVDEFIPAFCESLFDHIAELRIYFCYFDRPFVAAYGRGHGERFHPRDFIDKNQDLLLHVCALLYAKESERPEETIQMDHFESHTTPAWRTLTKLGCGLQIYYSGGECNALISLADQVLRIIELHQYGWVDPPSILRPIREHLPQVSKKLKFNEVGKSDEEMNLLTPDLELGVAKESYLKHPIFFLLWNPSHPRKDSRPAFEWSPVYNATMSKAFDGDGCVKTFAGVEEHIFWDKSRDYLVSWSPMEDQLVAELRQMGFDLPTILTEKDLGLLARPESPFEKSMAAQN